jgi:ATP-binding cassette subfamily C protein CydC
MAHGDDTPDAQARPTARAPVAPWVLGASLLAVAQWATLPLAARGYGATPQWWLPLVAGALLRQVAAPAYRTQMALRVRPWLLARVAARALSSGAFESEPSSLGALTQRIEYALAQSLPTLVGGALTTALFAAMAARALPLAWTASMTLACAGAVAVRLLARRRLDASSDAMLDALRAESAWLHAAARGRWEITGAARDRFLSDAGANAARLVSAERDHHARTRAVRSAQLALFIAPLAWLLRERAARGAAVSLHDWALVLPALAPALAALRALDELAVARRSLARLDAARAPDRTPSRQHALDAPLTLTAVTVRYGAHVALASVSLTVPPRGVLAVVGPNGAGKSTLAHVIAGAVAPDEGEVSVAGVPMGSISPEAVALVPQHPCFIEGASVRDNVHLAAPSATDDEITAALTALGLSVGPSHRAADLSRGEQRRVAIARALLRKPRWLVLDEPDAWLDRDGRAALQRVLREAAGGAAVVLVTHRADLVDWADRVVVLSPAHAVEASGPPRETLAASATGRALLASLADESLRFSAR